MCASHSSEHHPRAATPKPSKRQFLIPTPRKYSRSPAALGIFPARAITEYSLDRSEICLFYECCKKPCATCLVRIHPYKAKNQLILGIQGGLRSSEPPPPAVVTHKDIPEARGARIATRIPITLKQATNPTQILITRNRKSQIPHHPTQSHDHGSRLAEPPALRFHSRGCERDTGTRAGTRGRREAVLFARRKQRDTPAFSRPPRSRRTQSGEARKASGRGKASEREKATNALGGRKKDTTAKCGSERKMISTDELMWHHQKIIGLRKRWKRTVAVQVASPMSFGQLTSLILSSGFKRESSFRGFKGL